MRLHWKLMLTYVSVVMVVIAAVHLYLDRAMNAFLLVQLERELVREVRLVQVGVSQQGGLDSLEEIDQLANDLGQRLEARVTLIDVAGRVVGDSAVPFDDLDDLDNHGDRPEVIAARKSGRGSRLRHSSTLGVDMLYVAASLPNMAQGEVVVYLARPLRDVGQMKQPISRALWMASAMGLGLALLLAYGSSRYVSRPIVDMTRIARDVASGIFTRRTPKGATSHELRDLASALDDMRGQTQTRIGQITLEKSRLEAVLSSITEGILVTEQNGRVSMANRAFSQLFGIVDSVVGRMPIELSRNRDVQEAIDRTQNSGQVLFLDVTLSDGLERYLDVHVAPILQDGTCIGTVTVFYDITELRRLERIRKDFVANASHELRTPLTTIKGCAATLSEGALDDPDAAQRFVQMINTHADRLHNLVEDVLDLSRMESGTPLLDVETLRLRRIVDSAVGQVRALAGEKDIQIEVAIEDELQVQCDPKLVEQALLNLLDNAVKYTEEGGLVRVQTRRFKKEGNGRVSESRVSPEASEVSRSEMVRRGDVAESSVQRIAVEVQDTGIGIPLSSMARIFERFYRVDQGRSRAMGGTGLGLSIVRHIMDAHGERVYVESVQGKGSTFGLTLPLA